MMIQNKKFYQFSIPILGTILMMGMTPFSLGESDVLICEGGSNWTTDKTVIVPKGTSCAIHMVNAYGDVIVYGDLYTSEHVNIYGDLIISGGTLDSFGSAGAPPTIGGDLIIRNSDFVRIFDHVNAITTIGGDIYISNSNTVEIWNTDIGGDLSLRNNNKVELNHISVGNDALCIKNDFLTGSGNTYVGDNYNCPV